MSEHDRLIDDYLAAWNEADPAARRALIARSYAEDARYCDPKLEAEGHAAIDGMVQAVHGMFPGHRFTRRGAAEAHHDVLRFGWAFGPGAGGPPVVTGLDVATLGADGRLRTVIGFFDAAA